MQTEFGIAGDAVSSLAVSVKSGWDVRADASYDVPRREPRPHGLVACRTTDGEGWLQSWTGRTFQLPPGSLLIVENKEIKHYRCPGSQWDFWWFEFSASGMLPFPTAVPVPVPLDSTDASTVAEILSLLQRTSPQAWALASASLSRLLHLWSARCEHGFAQSPHQDAIDKLIRLMHKHPDGSLTVPRMAVTAGLSQSRLRQVFHAATGIAPKRFYVELRLDKARELLRQGMTDVAGAADQFGFSSPFHFSKAFSARFGHPPSRVKPNVKR